MSDNPPTCEECGGDKEKVQLESFEGEWVCRDCDLPIVF